MKEAPGARQTLRPTPYATVFFFMILRIEMSSALSLQVFCFISFARIVTSPATIVFTGFGNQYFQLRLKLLLASGTAVGYFGGGVR